MQSRQTGTGIADRIVVSHVQPGPVELRLDEDGQRARRSEQNVTSGPVGRRAGKSDRDTPVPHVTDETSCRGEVVEEAFLERNNAAGPGLRGVRGPAPTATSGTAAARAGRGQPVTTAPAARIAARNSAEVSRSCSSFIVFWDIRVIFW